MGGMLESIGPESEQLRVVERRPFYPAPPPKAPTIYSPNEGWSWAVGIHITGTIPYYLNRDFSLRNWDSKRWYEAMDSRVEVVKTMVK